MGCDDDDDEDLGNLAQKSLIQLISILKSNQKVRLPTFPSGIKVLSK